MPEKVILDYGEIISLLKICKLYDIKLTLTFNNNRTTGKIIEISEYIMSIKADFEIPPSVKSIDISFELNKEPYHFKSDVVKIFSKDITILIPSQIEIWKPRKYERSICYGKVFCSINIIKDLSENIRKKFSSLPPRLAPIFKEISKDTPNVSLIIKMIQDELVNISDLGELVLHKQGENLPLPVIIVSKYKKCLLVEDTQDDTSYFKKYSVNEVISLSNFMQDLQWSEEKIKEEVRKFKAFFTNNNIRSITYVPIFLFENVVGHIRVASLLSKISKILTVRDVFYIKALADIVSEALAKYKLFSLSSTNEFPLPIYDISPGGVKVEIEQFLAKFLEPGTKVKLNIKFNDGKIIYPKGKILRIDTEEEKLFVAVEFENLDKTEEFIITDFVNKNKE